MNYKQGPNGGRIDIPSQQNQTNRNHFNKLVFNNAASSDSQCQTGPPNSIGNRKKSPVANLMSNLGSNKSSQGDFSRSPKAFNSQISMQQQDAILKKTLEQKSNMKSKGQLGSPTSKMFSSKPSQYANKYTTPQFSMQASTGSIGAQNSYAIGSTQSQKLNVDIMNQKWPQYLNTLKNVELVQKKLTQQGSLKVFQIGVQCRKELLIRIQHFENKIKGQMEKLKVENRTGCQFGPTASTNLKQTGKVNTLGRVSRASDGRSSNPTQFNTQKTRSQFNNHFTYSVNSRGLNSKVLSPVNQDDQSQIAGPRPFSKPPLTQVTAAKTQNPSIRNSPKLEIRKAIYIATDGADGHYKEETIHSTQNQSQTQKNSKAKSPAHSKLNTQGQQNLKTRFQRALQPPHRHSRNQSKLAIGSSRQNSKLNINNSSYGLSGHLTKFTSGGFAIGSQALKSSPALWTGYQLEDEKKKMNKGTTSIPDHTIPTATLHLSVGISDALKEQKSQDLSKSKEYVLEQALRSTKTVYGVTNPRRPSAVLQINNHQRTNTLELKDSRRPSNQHNTSTNFKNKVSPRSNQSRDFSKKRGSPPKANCLSDMSAKSSGSKTSTGLQQRRIQSKKYEHQNLKYQKNKKLNDRSKPSLNIDQGIQKQKDRYSLQTSPNLQIGISALKQSNQQSQKKQGRQQTHKPNNLSINRLRSYSPRVNLSQLQNIKVGQTERQNDQQIEQQAVKQNNYAIPGSSYLHITSSSSAFNTVIVNSARNNKLEAQKSKGVSESQDSMTQQKVFGVQGISKNNHSRKQDSTHLPQNYFSGSGSPERRGVTNTTAPNASQVNTSRFFASQRTSDSRGKQKKRRDQSATSGLFSPHSRGNNDSNMTKSNMGENATTIENTSQMAAANSSVTQKTSVQVSRIFLNLVESLLQSIQTQLNPRQTKEFERNFQNLITQNAKEIDPYLNVKCFQLSRPNWSTDAQIDKKIVERGNILHFLSASGHFPGILDFILRKKCQAKHALDRNQMTIANKDGQEKAGNTALHLACLSLRQKSIEKLLLSRVNVNVASGEHCDTPLHLLIKMYSHQQNSLAQQTEDLGVDIDLEDIRECIQLILPFCEESLVKKNKLGERPLDIIVKNNLQCLSLIINEQYPGYFDDQMLNQSPVSKMSSPRVTYFSQSNQEQVEVALQSDHNIDMDYIEVKDDELDEFNQTDKSSANKHQIAAQGWKTNSKLKEAEAFTTGTPPRFEINNQILKNYIDKKTIQTDKIITAEGLSSSAQQANRKESTKSYKETSRKYELSEIEERESPQEEQADKTAAKKEIKIEAVKIAYHGTPNKNMRGQDASQNQQSRDEQNSEWRMKYAKSNEMLLEQEMVGQFANDSLNPPLQIDVQQIQQSQLDSQLSHDQNKDQNIANTDQCGEQSAEAQDRHSGQAFTSNNQPIGVTLQVAQSYKNHQNSRYLNQVQHMQTGGSKDKLLRQQAINTSREPDSYYDKYSKLSNHQSPQPNFASDYEKSKSLRRQSREDELSAKKKKQTNNVKNSIGQRDKLEPVQMKHHAGEQPENFTESNASRTRQEGTQGNNAQTVQTTQNFQSINTKQQSLYVQSQINSSPMDPNQPTTNQQNDKIDCKTIFNVDTPDRDYNINLNDNISESIGHDPESAFVGTVAASAVEFDNVSSLKQNIQRMQLSEVGQSMQSGADSRISRRSQRPRKLANKKVIGGESFGNEADFAESDKKQGKLMRVPPNLKPNPSQPNQLSENSYKQIQYTANSQEEKLILNSKKSTKESDEIGPHCFLTHQLLGTGSFGEVFLVEEKKTGKLMAMKVLSKQKAREQKLLKYNFAEKEIMARMTKEDHPFVVKLYYTFQTTESLFMVMEFCAGGDLSQYLEVEGCFNETKAKQYICEIVCAIEALHQNNIIFRDLKPDNIVLDSEGHAMLVDFGLSRQNVKGNANGADSFCGSYAYLAPEMIKKKGHGKAVDWYLIGVVLYELLTGMPPFYDDDKEILFKNITNQKLEFPPDEELPLTRVCKDFIGQLLHKDPNKRLGIQNGIKDIKGHAFFAGVDWRKVEKKKYRQPEAYLAEMALSIIRKDPYALKDHPRTKGKLSQKGDTNHLDGWEVNLIKDNQVIVKAPVINKKLK